MKTDDHRNETNREQVTEESEIISARYLCEYLASGAADLLIATTKKGVSAAAEARVCL